MRISLFNMAVDPRIACSDKDWRRFFWKTVTRVLVQKSAVIGMLTNPAVDSFTMVQEVNMGGEYQRLLWPAETPGEWNQYVASWEHMPMVAWESQFTDMVHDKEYDYAGARFRAVKLTQYHVTFYRCAAHMP